MIQIIPKIGLGAIENPIRPDATFKKWQVLEERETEFVIEILDDELSN